MAAAEESSMELGTQPSFQSQMEVTEASQPTTLNDIKQEKDTFKFPDTLEGFNYEFDKEGRFVDKDSGGPFEFNVGDPKYNQKRYETIGEIITNYVYTMLEKEGNLKKVHIPVDATEGEPQSFIFQSEDALTNPDKLMIILHGNGVVRAGQWARRLIMNDCLNSGTQLPFIKRAIESGYGVLVLNTNENTRGDGADKVIIRENGCPEDHFHYVWDTFVRRASAKDIAIVAHSYGGVVILNEMITNEDFMERVFAVAFTDSVHNPIFQEAPKSVIKFLRKKTQNWVSSKEPLDEPVVNLVTKDDSPRVSAGDLRHEMTSWSAFESIFKFFHTMYDNMQPREEKNHTEEL